MIKLIINDSVGQRNYLFSLFSADEADEASDHDEPACKSHDEIRVRRAFDKAVETRPATRTRMEELGIPKQKRRKVSKRWLKKQMKLRLKHGLCEYQTKSNASTSRFQVLVRVGAPQFKYDSCWGSQPPGTFNLEK